MKIVGFQEFEKIYKEIRKRKSIVCNKKSKIMKAIITIITWILLCVSIICLISSCYLWYNNNKTFGVFFFLAFYFGALIILSLNMLVNSNIIFNDSISYEEICLYDKTLNIQLKHANINGICDIIKRRNDKKITFIKSLWTIVMVLILPFKKNGLENNELIVLSMWTISLGTLPAFVILLAVTYPTNKSNIMNEYLEFLNQFQYKIKNNK